jgi:lysozyme family protein
MTRDEIITFVIENFEGTGIVDDPRDPGGKTKKGISQRLLDNVRKQDPTWPATVDELTDGNIHDLYVIYFWNPIRGDQLPPALAFAMVDTAINQGPPTAIMMLQRAVNVAADAVLGTVTMQAISRMHPEALFDEFIARRGYHYAELFATSAVFELGWFRRLASVDRIAAKLL